MKVIARDDVQNLMRGKAYLIEVLPTKQYNEVHLPYAKNIPLNQLNRASVAGLQPNRSVIVYCYDYQ